MEEVKCKILGKAHELFSKFGVRSVTMDEIAQKLSISKRTIYACFKNKKELVNEDVTAKLELEMQKLQEIKNSSENAIEMIYKISKLMREFSNDCNPNLFLDLEKFFPEAWAMFVEFRDNVIFAEIKYMIDRGIEEAYFRADINSDVLAKLRLAEIEMCLRNDLFSDSKYDTFELVTQLWDHYVYGLLTDKGKQLLEQYNNK